MSRQCNSSPSASKPCGQTRPEELDPITERARCAHELANLLDAGLRNISLVMSSLRNSSDHKATTSNNDDPVSRLDTVSQSLTQMAKLLQGWIQEGSVAHYPTDSATLGQTAAHLMRLFGPLADQNDIEMRVSLSDEAAHMPAGPTYSVMANAVRNSIEAIQKNDGPKSDDQSTIVLSACVDHDQIRLRIIDNGPGLNASLANERGQFRFGLSTKSGRNGVGLSLLHQIAAEMGGGLEIKNTTQGGAELTMWYPVDHSTGGPHSGLLPMGPDPGQDKVAPT